MRFSLMVALSHLRARRSDAGISVITLISIGGVLIGVAALIMVLAVMEGFEVDLRDKILGANAHLVVRNYGGAFEGYDEATDKVAATPGVVAAAPFIYAEAMVRSAWTSTGVILWGLDEQRSADVIDVVRNLKVGPLGPFQDDDERRELLATLREPPRGLVQASDDDEVLPGVLIGDELAELLRVYPGDRIHLINPVGGGVGPMGVPTPYVRAFRVAGLFDSGMYEYDNKWVYTPIPDAQTFLKMGDLVSGIEARVEDFDAADEVGAAVEAQLGQPYSVVTWKNMNRNLFSALKLEKIVMGLILSLIVAVASANIVGTLILTVFTRTREIAILRAMGASSRAVRAIFMLEGLIIGVVGSVVGTAVGLLGCVGLDQYEYRLDTDVYYLDTLPVVVVPSTVLVVAGLAIAISFLATLYPATVAARMNPVEGLRYE